MIINLIYIFFILVGMYYAIIAYRETKRRPLLVVMGIFILSLGLEFERLNEASYKLDVNDMLRTIRDIIRTLMMIYIFGFGRKCYEYIGDLKTRLTKNSKKK